MNQSCRFCKIVNGEYTHDTIDKPFAESEKYIAMSSIGAIIEGWTLILPKEHTLSMRDAYKDVEFSIFFNEVHSKMLKEYGKSIVFEHGSNCENSRTACGTNHAHIHLVPFSGSLTNYMLEDKSKEWHRVEFSKIKEFVSQSEYLCYYEVNPDEVLATCKSYIHILKEPTSQYFRKALAEKMHMKSKYDYKEFPFISNSELTAQKMGKIADI